MYRIKIDRSRCIGCVTSVTACVVLKDAHGHYRPIFCRHCEKPECVYTCMTGAMRKNPETGYVEYHREQCASCYMCIMSCPYGVLKYDSIRQQEIMKCNMCVHRSEDGSASPMCVEKCPMQAITLEEI